MMFIKGLPYFSSNDSINTKHFYIFNTVREIKDFGFENFINHHASNDFANI